MKSQNKKLLDDLLRSRKALFELIIATVLLAFGVNLLAGTFVSFFKIDSWILIVISICLIVLSIHFLSKKLIYKRNRFLFIEAFLVYKKDVNSIIDIPRYRYGSSLYDYFKSIFSENKAIKALWDNEPFSKMFEFDKDINKMFRRDTQSKSLVIEATEYFILDRLSTHLTDYFNNENFDKSIIKEFVRNDVPDILLKNRFMEIFTKPMDQREAFMEQTKNKIDKSKVVASFGKNRAIYQRFDLVLPKESKVSRINDHTIRITTNKFELDIAVNFSGSNTVLPRYFEKYYLLIDKFSDSSTYKVDVSINVHFKFSSFFSKKQWDYHAWIDSFLISLNECMSEELFFKKINWETVLTIIQCNKKQEL